MISSEKAGERDGEFMGPECEEGEEGEGAAGDWL